MRRTLRRHPGSRRRRRLRELHRHPHLLRRRLLMELLLRLSLHELVLQLIMIELRRILELDGRHRARVVACRRRLLLRRHLLWRRDWRVQRGTRR